MPRVVVVGGSSGIGLAAARRALDEGWEVTVASRDPGRCPLDVKTVVLDATDAGGVSHAFAALGAIDHLVWTAGVSAPGSARSADLDQGRRSFDAKILGPLAAIQASEIGSSIVLMSGLAASVPAPGAFFTGAVNGAVEATVRGLARELAPVRVNAVAPGLIDTPLYDGLPGSKRQELFDRVAAVLPAARVGAPDDVADAIWYLMTNAFVTGTVLAVDGGSRLIGV